MRKRIKPGPPPTCPGPYYGHKLCTCHDEATEWLCHTLGQNKD